MTDVEVVQLIRTTLATVGKGVEGDPIRRLIQYWTMEGVLVFEWDEWASQGSHKVETI